MIAFSNSTELEVEQKLINKSVANYDQINETIQFYQTPKISKEKITELIALLETMKLNKWFCYTKYIIWLDLIGGVSVWSEQSCNLIALIIFYDENFKEEVALVYSPTSYYYLIMPTKTFTRLKRRTGHYILLKLKMLSLSQVPMSRKTQRMAQPRLTPSFLLRSGVLVYLSWNMDFGMVSSICGRAHTNRHSTQTSGGEFFTKNL